jgi:hypothetical protein
MPYNIRFQNKQDFEYRALYAVLHQQEVVAYCSLVLQSFDQQKPSSKQSEEAKLQEEAEFGVGRDDDDD